MIRYGVDSVSSLFAEVVAEVVAGLVVVEVSPASLLACGGVRN